MKLLTGSVAFEMRAALTVTIRAPVFDGNLTSDLRDQLRCVKIFMFCLFCCSVKP